MNNNKKYMDKEKIKMETEEVLDEMRAKTEQLKGSAKHALNEIEEKAKDARRKADRYILDNPERSVIVSAGVGLIIGFGLAMLMKGRGRCRNH